MARHKSRAFVLSAADYRETSRLLQLFCENEGRISVIARGLRSPKSKKAHLADAFNLLQVNYTLKDGATLGLLTSLEPEHLYSSLRTSLDAYALASYWFEILKVAAQSRIGGHEVFRLTDLFLQSLQAGATSVRSALPVASVQNLVDLAQELGFGMQLFACGVCCGTSQLRHFSISTGTAICRNCPPPAGRVLIIPDHLAVQLPFLEKAISATLAPAESAALLRIYNEFLTTHLDHRFVTFQFLQGISS